MTWQVRTSIIAITLSSALLIGAEPASQPATDATASTAATTTTTQPATGSSEPNVPSATSLDEATGRFDAALRNAREQYLKDLAELRRKAIRAEDLKTANEMNSLIDQLGGVAAPPPSPKLRRVARVSVRADQEWQRSPVLVRAGDTLRLTVSGEWTVNNADAQLTTYGPDGLRRDGTADFHGLWAVLCARIGYRIYFVGRGTVITAEQDGAVEFRSNDFNLGDNRGAVTVQVTRE